MITMKKDAIEGIYGKPVCKLNLEIVVDKSLFKRVKRLFFDRFQRDYRKAEGIAKSLFSSQHGHEKYVTTKGYLLPVQSGFLSEINGEVYLLDTINAKLDLSDNIPALINLDRVIMGESGKDYIDDVHLELERPVSKRGNAEVYNVKADGNLLYLPSVRVICTKDTQPK